MLLRVKILEHIQDENQAGGRQFEGTDVGDLQVHVQVPQGVTRGGDAAPVQIATDQPPAAVAKSRPREGDAITAAEVDDSARSEVLIGEQPEDPVEPDLPAYETTVGPRAVRKELINKTCVVVNGIPKPHEKEGDQSSGAAEERARDDAADDPGEESVF